jgi:peptidoglycan/xylan/chitin deacetylase (PgdA/CDA1 family)
MIWFIVLMLMIVAWFSYRYAWWRKPVDYSYPRILMYHMIREHINGKKFNSLRVFPAIFDKQIKYLSENGWHSFTMHEAITNRDKLPEKNVVITFDDGYRDNLINALPILKKYNFKATIYLVNDRHDRDWSGYRKTKNEGAGLKDEPKLSDDDVRELIRSGLIEIGAHTLTHVNLSALGKDESYKEICKSKVLIEKEFNIICDSFAYPFGLYKNSDVFDVPNCGYTNAVTTKTGIADLKNCNLFEIPRITISGKDNMLAFKIKLKRGSRGWKK